MKKFMGAAVVAMTCGMTVLGQETMEEFAVKNDKDFSVRISVGSVPGVNEFKVDKGGTFSIKDDTGARIEVLAVKRFFGGNNSNIGGMFGGGIFFSGNSGKDSLGDKVELSTFGGMIQGGLAIKAGENVVFEFGPYLGVGVAKNETTKYTSGRGPYGLFGVKGGVFVILNEHFEFGLEVGYEAFAQNQEFKGSNDITFSGDGFHGALVGCIKF